MRDPRKLYNFSDINLDRQVIELIDMLKILVAEKQPLDADLTALSALTTTGLLARIAADTYALRTITGTAGEITVVNGDGVSGDPILSLPSVITTPISFGDGTNQTTVETDGTIKFEGAATTFNDINLSMNSMANTGATILDVLTIGGNKLKAFIGTGGSTQQVDGSLELLHDYKEGSDITPHVHWMPEDTNTGDVKLSLGYRWFNRTDPMSAETILTVTQAAGGVQYQHNTAVFAAISGAGKTIGSRFVFRVFRDPGDAADTYTHYAIALDFGLHYECDTVGSRQILNK